MAEEQQDLNEFKRWDTLFATGFLAIVPAVMHWVFIGHDVLKVAAIGGIAVIACLAVLVLSFIFPERTVGRIVNKIGVIMAPLYLVLAIWLFCLKWGGDTTPLPAEQPAASEETPATEHGQTPNTSQAPAAE